MNVNTPSTNSVGSATSAKTLNSVPPLDTCAVRPSPTRALDTLPRNSAERDALSEAACERAPASPKCSVVSAVSRCESSATRSYSTPRPACPAATEVGEMNPEPRVVGPISRVS
jgi:hypothetical protein